MAHRAVYSTRFFLGTVGATDPLTTVYTVEDGFVAVVRCITLFAPSGSGGHTGIWAGPAASPLVIAWPSVSANAGVILDLRVVLSAGEVVATKGTNVGSNIVSISGYLLTAE